MERLEVANSTLNVAKMTDTDEEQVKWMSLAVAHNHMANVIWREIIHTAKQLEVGHG